MPSFIFILLLYPFCIYTLVCLKSSLVSYSCFMSFTPNIFFHFLTYFLPLNILFFIFFFSKYFLYIFFHFILLAPSFLMACFSFLSCLFAFSSASFIPPLFVLCFRAFALSCRTSFFSLFIAFTFCLTGSIPPYFVVYFLFYSSPRSCTFLWYFYGIFSLFFLYIYTFLHPSTFFSILIHYSTSF